MARAPVSPRNSRVASGVGPAGAAFPPAGTAGTQRAAEKVGVVGSEVSPEHPELGDDQCRLACQPGQQHEAALHYFVSCDSWKSVTKIPSGFRSICAWAFGSW